MPSGGEWIDLEPLDRPLLRALPRRSKSEGAAWSARARATWEAWRLDPATSQWTAADEAFALETLYLVDALTTEVRGNLAAEIRLRQDALGLTAQGKRRLRWRVVEPSDDAEPEQPVNVPKLRAVDG